MPLSDPQMEVCLWTPSPAKPTFSTFSRLFLPPPPLILPYANSSSPLYLPTTTRKLTYYVCLLSLNLVSSTLFITIFVWLTAEKSLYLTYTYTYAYIRVYVVYLVVKRKMIKLFLWATNLQPAAFSGPIGFLVFLDKICKYLMFITQLKNVVLVDHF